MRGVTQKKKGKKIALPKKGRYTMGHPTRWRAPLRNRAPGTEKGALGGPDGSAAQGLPRHAAQGVKGEPPMARKRRNAEPQPLHPVGPPPQVDWFGDRGPAIRPAAAGPFMVASPVADVPVQRRVAHGSAVRLATARPVAGVPAGPGGGVALV